MYLEITVFCRDDFIQKFKMRMLIFVYKGLISFDITVQLMHDSDVCLSFTENCAAINQCTCVQAWSRRRVNSWHTSKNRERGIVLFD